MSETHEEHPTRAELRAAASPETRVFLEAMDRFRGGGCEADALDAFKTYLRATLPPPAVKLCVTGFIADTAGRILLVHHRTRGWELPGGKVEPGEPWQSALVREVREETGLDVALAEEHPRLLVGEPAPGAPFASWIALARGIAEGDPRPGDPDGLIDDARWFARDEVPLLQLSKLTSADVVRAWVLESGAAPMTEERAREVGTSPAAILGEVYNLRKIIALTIGRLRAAESPHAEPLMIAIERHLCGDYKGALAALAALAAREGDVPAGAEQERAAVLRQLGADERDYEKRGGDPQTAEKDRALFFARASAVRVAAGRIRHGAHLPPAGDPAHPTPDAATEPRRTFEQDVKAATMAGAAAGMRRVLDRMGVPPAGVDAPIDDRKEVVARYGAPRLTPATLTREEARERLLTLGEGPLLLAMPRESLAYYEQLVTMANADHEYAHLRDRWARTVAILRAHVAHLDANGGAKDLADILRAGEDCPRATWDENVAPPAEPPPAALPALRSRVAELRQRFDSYAGGDRPMSPPADLTRALYAAEAELRAAEGRPL